LSAADLAADVHVPIVLERQLNLSDLRGGNPVALGIPSNTIRAGSRHLGQRASLAACLRPDRPDGIWYPSRLNADENLAIYVRASPQLAAGERRKLQLGQTVQVAFGLARNVDCYGPAPHRLLATHNDDALQ
jgi:hypothetical protein